MMSPDEPLLYSDRSDPASWNLYAYGMNNPLLYTDPSGHFGEREGGPPPGLNPLDELLYRAFLNSLDNLQRARDLAHQVIQSVDNFRNNPNCAAGMMIAGTAIGAGVGGAGGGAVFGVVGGVGGSVIPGAGTVAGAVGGGTLGYVGGGLVGGSIGGAVGALGTIACNVGSGGSGGPGNTKHGQQRIAERGFSDAELTTVRTGEKYSQPDGAVVFVKKLVSGRYNVLVEGDGGKVVTAIKNKTLAEVKDLARRFQWQ